MSAKQKRWQKIWGHWNLVAQYPGSWPDTKIDSSAWSSVVQNSQKRISNIPSAVQLSKCSSKVQCLLHLISLFVTFFVVCVLKSWPDLCLFSLLAQKIPRQKMRKEGILLMLSKIFTMFIMHILVWMALLIAKCCYFHYSRFWNGNIILAFLTKYIIGLHSRKSTGVNS